jgi:hypothetical protein
MTSGANKCHFTGCSRLSKGAAEISFLKGRGITQTFTCPLDSFPDTIAYSIDYHTLSLSVGA